jgi:hypothetical protein
MRTTLSLICLVLLPLFSTNIQAQSTIAISEGWNLISSPVQPSSPSVTSVLAPISGKYDAVYAYNSSTNSYTSYIPGEDGNTLNTIEWGRGYWLYANSSASLSISGSNPGGSVQLVEGWNLVGFPGTTATPAAQALSSISGKYEAVYGFTSNQYEGFIPGGDSDMTTMSPGKGYWIYATESAQWTVRSSTTPPTQPGKMLPLQVSPNGRYFVTSDGKPFFVAGDTAYFLAKNSKRDDIDYYFKDCAQRGINVIFMSFVHRYNQGNAFGDMPWSGNNAGRIITTPGNNPNNAQEYDYWDHVDFIIDKAEEHKLYLFMMPLFVTLGADGYAAFSGGSHVTYAKWLGERYKNRTHITYVLGGDNDPKPNQVTLWREFAKALATGANDGQSPDYTKVFCSYLPTGEESSSTWFHKDEWLDFNIQQTHRHFHLIYPMVKRDYNLTPAKPTVDGEPLYENHHSVSASQREIRRQFYQFQMGGGFFVFGEQNVKELKPAWKANLNSPGRRAFIAMKNALEKKEWWKLVPDQSVIASGAGSPPNISVASISSDGDFAFIYFDTNKALSINMSKFKGAARATWINPANGETQSGGGPYTGTQSLKPPSGLEDALLLLETGN